LRFTKASLFFISDVCPGEGFGIGIIV